MRYTVNANDNRVLMRRSGPPFEDLCDFLNAIGVKPSLKAPLEIIHSRSGIILSHSTADTICGVGQLRLIAAPVKGKSVGVIEDFGGEAGLSCRRFEYGSGGFEIAVVASLEGLLNIHRRILAYGLSTSFGLFWLRDGPLLYVS